MPADTSTLPTDIGSLIALITGLTGAGSGDWEKIANRADPWGPNRERYQGELNAFMTDPSSIFQDPAFQAAQRVGSENISRQAGAAGMSASGNRLADLFRFGQSSGLDFERQRFGELANLAGVNAGSPAAAAGIQAHGLQTQGTNLASGLGGILPMIMQLLGMGGGSGAGGMGDIISRLFGGGGGTINTNVPNNTVPGGFNPWNSDVPPATDWTSGSDLPSGIDWSGGNGNWTSGGDLPSGDWFNESPIQLDDGWLSGLFGT